MISAGGMAVEVKRSRHGNTSSATAADGKTSRERSGQRWGWKVGRCRHVQVSELFSMWKCDKAVLEFLATTDVGKFPPRRWRTEVR